MYKLFYHKKNDVIFLIEAIFFILINNFYKNIFIFNYIYS